MTWKILEKQYSHFKCPKCGKNHIKYREVEDSYGHEDYNYWCQSCGYSWWGEGSDY